MKVNLEKIIPEIGWDFFGRLIPGFIVLFEFKYCVGLVFPDFIPMHGLAIFVPAYILGYILQPFGSRIEGYANTWFVPYANAFDVNRNHSDLSFRRCVKAIGRILKSSNCNAHDKVFQLQIFLSDSYLSFKWWAYFLRGQKIKEVIDSGTLLDEQKLKEVERVFTSKDYVKRELMAKQYYESQVMTFDRVLGQPVLIIENIISAKKKHPEAVAFFSIFLGTLISIAIIWREFDLDIFRHYLLLLITPCALVCGLERTVNRNRRERVVAKTFEDNREECLTALGKRKPEKSENS